MKEIREQLYPYDKDPHEHEYAYVLYNAAGLGLDFEACNVLAKHLFDDLKCGPPGTLGEALVHYDALGTNGGPWRRGKWRPIDEPRAEVVATAVDKNVSDMTEEELAELKAAIAAVETAKRSGAIGDSQPAEVE